MNFIRPMMPETWEDIEAELGEGELHQPAAAPAAEPESAALSVAMRCRSSREVTTIPPPRRRSKGSSARMVVANRPIRLESLGGYARFDVLRRIAAAIELELELSKSHARNAGSPRAEASASRPPRQLSSLPPSYSRLPLSFSGVAFRRGMMALAAGLLVVGALCARLVPGRAQRPASEGSASAATRTLTTTASPALSEPPPAVCVLEAGASELTPSEAPASVARPAAAPPTPSRSIAARRMVRWLPPLPVEPCISHTGPICNDD